MCGICGFFNYKTNQKVQKENIVSILESIRYRGPDHLGTYVDKEIGIGNVRLSIQGISNVGNQPIFNESRTVVVVYNGEIYNYNELHQKLVNKGHHFNSNTDTEVLVHLYEEYNWEMAKELNGMFAFALFDIKKRILLLGRDRAGQKPLYINNHSSGVFFSSELKSMLPYIETKSLNALAVNTYISIGYALEPGTIIKEIDLIEPGSLYGYSKNGMKKHRIWNGMPDQKPLIINYEQWKSVADEIFKKAIKRHLLSDVPVTLMLSGGVDSSLIALYLKDEGKIEKAYTASFTSHDDYDEFDYASKLAKYCGFEVERIRLSNEELADNIDNLLSKASIPQGDTSSIATFCLAKEISREYRVVLGGDGGDELFAGYPTYSYPYIYRKASFIPPSVLDIGRILCSKIFDSTRYMSLPFRFQQLYSAWGKETIEAHFHLKCFLNESFASELIEYDCIDVEKLQNDAIKRVKSYYNSINTDDHIRKACWVDFNTFLRSQTIPKVERNTMLFSLESRMPFLDNEIIKLSFSTDSTLKMRGLKTKKCLRRLLHDKIKGRTQTNPVKQGFTPPIASMLKKELKEWSDNWLNYRSPFLKPDTIKRVNKIEEKGWDLHRLKWHICTLNDWCYRNAIK